MDFDLIISLLEKIPIIIFFFLLLLGIIYFAIIRKKAAEKWSKFLDDYEAFLQKHDGEMFFCYTNRKNSEKLIEKHILPQLDDHVHIIKLIGKDPVTKLDNRCISHMLHKINQIGYPNIMKIVNSEVIDSSIHNEVYAAINENRENDLISIFKDGVSLLNKNISHLQGNREAS